MDRSREVLKIATFRPLVLTRKNEGPGTLPAAGVAPPPVQNAGLQPASTLLQRTGSAIPWTDPGAERAGFSELKDKRCACIGSSPRDGIGQGLALVNSKDAQVEANHPGVHHREAGCGSDSHVPLMRTESIPQSIDHRGNFFRLPDHGAGDKSDPGSTLRVLTDPNITPSLAGRIRQDRRIQILAQAEFGRGPEPVPQQELPKCVPRKDPPMA